MSKRVRTGRASDASGNGETKAVDSASNANAAEDASEDFKVHLLDVGEEKYGDCVLCQFGDVSVLIDGSHRGDDDLILKQLKRLLRQQTLPVRVSLLIVTHPHDDHIGCFPSLVAGDKLRADWALVADPKYRWGDPDENEDFFAGADYRTRALSEALLEEDRADLPDDELALFIDNAGTLVSRYRTMIRQLESRGTRVVRNGSDNPAAMLAAFAGVGLKVVGPKRGHLEECRRLLLEGSQDSLDFVGDALNGDGVLNVVDAYRNLIGGNAAADFHDNPNKGAINLQSIVTRFEYRGERFIFGGDMQFADPEVESHKLVKSVNAMLDVMRDEAPYSLVKISHHASYNGMDDKVLAVFGDTKLYGICGGSHDSSHPHPAVLQLLTENSERLEWVRTDHNGLVSITFGGAEPQIRVRRGNVSDPTPNSGADADFAELLSSPTDIDDLFPQSTPAVAASPGASSLYGAGEIRVLVPANATKVNVSVDLANGNGSVNGNGNGNGVSQPPDEPSLFDVAGDGATAGDGVVALEVATAASDDVMSDGPPRSALVHEFNVARNNGWIEFFAEAGQRFNWPTALLMAVASRETNMRNILGDGGHGHGIMQIDDRSFPQFTSSGQWRIPRLNILKGAEVLNGKRRFLSNNGVGGETLSRASVAAYNGGEGRVLRAIRRGLGVDSVTTGRNYSADVLARAAVFRELLG